MPFCIFCGAQKNSQDEICPSCGLAMQNHDASEINNNTDNVDEQYDSRELNSSTVQEPSNNPQSIYEDMRTNPPKDTSTLYRISVDGGNEKILLELTSNEVIPWGNKLCYNGGDLYLIYKNVRTYDNWLKAVDASTGKDRDIFKWYGYYNDCFIEADNNIFINDASGLHQYDMKGKLIKNIENSEDLDSLFVCGDNVIYTYSQEYGKGNDAMWYSTGIYCYNLSTEKTKKIYDDVCDIKAQLQVRTPILRIESTEYRNY